MGTYTIGQVAERSGFSTSTLRYYEQHGLLQPAARTGSGYRLYDDTSLARLGFIERAKQLGCTLAEIAALTELWDARDCGPVQSRLHQLATAKIADARRASTELARFTAQLRTAAAHLGCEPVDGPCDEGCACLTDPSETVEASSTPGVLGEGAHPAIACSLPAGDVTERLNDWHAVLVHVTDRERMPDGGLRLGLDPTVPLDEVARLAAAEQRCCAFLALAITVDHRGTALEVRAPEEAADIVSAVFGTAAPTAVA